MDGHDIVERYEALDEARQNFKSHWQEIAEYMLPTKASILTKGAPGEKRTSKIYDGTAIRSLRILANGLYGHLTSPSAPWFALTVKNKTLAAVDGVKWWLMDTTQRMHAAINNSNFPLASQEIYTDLGAFGTAGLYCSAGRDSVMSFTSIPVGELAIAEDADGRVDTVYRCFEMTARQIIQRFGERAGGDVRKAAESQTEKDKRFEVIHAVFPRESREAGKIDQANKQWASYYVERGKKELLAEEGYDTFPYQVPRWAKDSGEVYGRSPGMDALPDTKMLNQMKKDFLRATQKMIDPPLMVSDEMRMRAVRTTPGGIIYYRSGGEKPAPLQTGGDYRVAEQLEMRTQQAIREAFFADLFMLLAQKPQNQMTATEVMERVEEKLVLLGPTMGRLQAELYNPLLNTVFGLMWKAGMILPPPGELAGAGLEIEYISKLALAMKKYETDAMMKTFGFVGPMAQVNPAVMDNFNMDEAARGAAERFGIPIDWMNPSQVVRRIREDRARAQAEAQKKQEEMMQAEMAAKAIPALAGDVGDKSLLAQMGQQQGGAQ